VPDRVHQAIPYLEEAHARPPTTHCSRTTRVPARQAVSGVWGRGWEITWRIDPPLFDPPAPGQQRHPGWGGGTIGRGVRPRPPSHPTTRGGARGRQQKRIGTVRDPASPARSAGGSSTARGCRHEKNVTAVIGQPLAATPGGPEHDYSC
jgi:hypothetical protein